MNRQTRLWAVSLLLVPAVASAMEPGERAPAFELPWLTEEGISRSDDLFSKTDVSVLFVWDRGCPHCVSVALSCGALDDSLSGLDAQAVGILLGPDEPDALSDFLWDKQVSVPHLWDRDRRTAGPYGLGSRHLGIFVIDRSGTVLAQFGDEVADLAGPTLPIVRAHLAHPLRAPRIASRSQPSVGMPLWSVDGRSRIASTEAARPNDRGLYGEPIENGAVWLYRVDLRLTWNLTSSIEFIPWLRLSNEEEEVLQEGAEQLSNRAGSATLRAHTGPLSGILGAYELRVSPLLLQRWDRSDAPPIGGASGCGCGGGTAGLRQHSLEVLRPEYTFEGLSANYRSRFARLRSWVAIPQWEHEVRTDAPTSEQLEARYRRVLYGSALDVGRTSSRESRFGLPTPIGLRVGFVAVEDDQRTLPQNPFTVRPADRGEAGWVGLARIGPSYGFSADGEWVEWEIHERGTETSAGAIRAGIELVWTRERLSFRAEGHRIRTDRGFDPLYRALTYSPNREGLRLSAGLSLLDRPGGMRERISLVAFLRDVRETEPTNPAIGRLRDRIRSLTLAGRPIPDLRVEGSWVEIRQIAPVSDLDEASSTGTTLDLKWEGWPEIDPTLHLERVRSDPIGMNPSIYWQTSISVRVLK